MPALAISSWSLHRSLGRAWYEPSGNGADRLANRSHEEARIDLLEVPSLAASHGIFQLEICHFHFPRTDTEYLEDLKGALERAGVKLFSVLIDTGDITHPDPARREEELALIRGWIHIAGSLGAGHTRVIAGESEAGEDAVQLSAAQLRDLAGTGRELGVRVLTENFRKLASRAEPLVAILEACEGEVGLCCDFGNFKGETKLEELEAILPYADSVHAKADYTEAGEMEQAAFVKCLDLSRAAQFAGPYSLIFQDPGDEWTHLKALKKEVTPYL